jgi:PAS domain S-box-containing protein/putative nucleotidyltransferase with HDIG domain
VTNEQLSLGKMFDSFSRLSLDGIWVVDTWGRILEVNEAYCKLSGYSREELLTMSIKDLEVTESAEEIVKTIAQIKVEGVARFERAHRRKDGVVFPVEINATFIEKGQQQIFLAFIRDVTLLKVVQKESAFNTALLRLSAQKTSLQEYSDAVVAHIRDWCGCQSVGLGLAQEPAGTIKFVASAGLGDSFAGCGVLVQPDPDKCLCFRLLHGEPEPQEGALLTPGGSIYCNNLPQFIAGLSERQQTKYRIDCLMMGMASVAIVPLRYHESLLGVILLAGYQEGQITLAAVQFLESMAPLVAEGITRHSVEAELELNLLKQGVINGLLNLSLEDLPLDELLRRSLLLLTSIPWIALESKGAIFLVADQPEVLVLRVQKGMPKPITQQCGRIPYGRCLCGRAAASRQLQFSEGCDELHEIGYPGMPSHGHYCIPILHGERVLGVMNLYVKTGHLRSASEEQFLSAVANTLAGIVMRREAEKARRRSDQEFSLLVGNVPAIVCKGYAEGYASFIDNKVEGMLGYSRDEFEQRWIKWTDLILKEDLGQARRIFLKALKGSNSYVREYRMRCKGGGIIWVQERSQIVLDAQGKIDYISGVLFDISKRKQGEEALRQEKETAQRYLDVAAVMFLVMDVPGNVTLINKRGCEILGYPEKEIVGRNWVEHFIPEKIRDDMQVMRKSILSGEIECMEYFENAVLTKSGEERIIAWHNTRLRNEAGEIAGCLSSGEDITLRRRAEEALQDSLNRVRRTLEGTVTALATAVETRDPYTAGHQRGVAQLACAIAAELGFSADRVEGIRVMGFLHDIGKIAIPAEILSKPGRLSEYEFNIVKFHSQVSYDILKEVDFPWQVALAVLQHHEKLDGSGYPHGLMGEDIIPEARILTVADVVEAMASHRPYRASLGIDQAIAEISQNRGVLYDPEVVDACLTVLRENRVEI